MKVSAHGRQKATRSSPRIPPSQRRLCCDRIERMRSISWWVLVGLCWVAAASCAGEESEAEYLDDDETSGDEDSSEPEPSGPPSRSEKRSRLSSADGTTTLFVYQSREVFVADEWRTQGETPV